jgi:ATP/maltotriose-dependent transcriptional regulator MalT
MALSQRQPASALELCRRVLAQTGLGIELTTSAKSVLGLAQVATGARREGLQALGEAAQLAAKSGSGQLAADTSLAHAEALLAAGDARRALEAARAAQQWFAAAGNQEAEWRSWLAAARAESALSHPDQSRENAQKARELLATLQQKWDADNYKTYLSRPDILESRTQLDKVPATR